MTNKLGKIKFSDFSDDEALNKYIALKEETDAVSKKYGREIIKARLKKYKEILPSIVALRWEQFTPYFNDGDACVFRVHAPSFKLSDRSIDSAVEDEEEFLDAWDLKYNNLITEDVARKLESVEELPAELYLDSFNDHVRVTYDFDSFTVDEYEHE